MKGTVGALALILGWLGLMFIPEFWPPSKPSPCAQAVALRQDIEKKLRGRKIEVLEEKKNALDDQLYKLQVSPEEYQRYREKVNMLDKSIAKADVEEQQTLDREGSQLSKAEMDCEKGTPLTPVHR